jgi:hypothetical protein
VKTVVTRETIDSYLIELDMPFEELSENIWRVDNEIDNVPAIIIAYAENVVVFRLKVMDIPKKNREALFRRLLELNAHGIALGAYAIEDSSIVLTDTLRAERMDLVEFRASLESLCLAAKQHYPELSRYLQDEEV